MNKLIWKVSGLEPQPGSSWSWRRHRGSHGFVFLTRASPLGGRGALDPAASSSPQRPSAAPGFVEAAHGWPKSLMAPRGPVSRANNPETAVCCCCRCCPWKKHWAQTAVVGDSSICMNMFMAPLNYWEGLFSLPENWIYTCGLCWSASLLLLAIWNLGSLKATRWCVCRHQGFCFCFAFLFPFQTKIWRNLRADLEEIMQEDISWQKE